MKAFNVIYKHGHFIDVETQQRLIPVQGAEYIITAVENAFTRDVSKIDYHGLGNLEIRIKCAADLEKAKPYILKSYEMS